MTDAEQRAAEVWAEVRQRNMPRGIALDFVEDVCGNRAEALRLLVRQAINAAKQQRAKVCESGWRRGAPNQLSSAIISDMELGRWEDADRKRRDHSRATRWSHWRDWQAWLDWFHEMKTVIRMCRELCDAAK